MTTLQLAPPVDNCIIRLRPARGLCVALAPVSAFDDGAEPDPDMDGAARLPAWRVAERTAARRLLRRLLHAELGPGLAAARIAARPGGQPYLIGRPDIGISLSHTHGRVAAAIGVGLDVGVDVQQPEPVSDALLRRCCLRHVRAELAALPDAARELEFAWIWSVQEACVKADGSGLSGRPWSIPVNCGERGDEWNGYRWLSLRADSAVPLSVAYGRREQR